MRARCRSAWAQARISERDEELRQHRCFLVHHLKLLMAVNLGEVDPAVLAASVTAQALSQALAATVNAVNFLAVQPAVVLENLFLGASTQAGAPQPS